MTICSLSLHQGNTESRKNLEQKVILQIGTLNPHGINERFHSTNLFLRKDGIFNMSRAWDKEKI